MRSGFETAYIDGAAASNPAYKPQFISNNYKQTRNEDGITTMSIYDFLLKENSLEL